MALLKLELLARVLMACGIPVIETVKKSNKASAHVCVSPTLRVHLLKNDCYQMQELLETGPALYGDEPELCILIEELRSLIKEFAPAYTKVRLEGERFQPDFQQMDHAEIAAWRLQEIGYDWISDEPDISLEEFQEMAQDYWEEAKAEEEICKREALERDAKQVGHDDE